MFHDPLANSRQHQPLLTLLLVCEPQRLAAFHRIRHAKLKRPFAFYLGFPGFRFTGQNAAQIELRKDGIPSGQFDRPIVIKRRDSTVFDIDLN